MSELEENNEIDKFIEINYITHCKCTHTVNRLGFLKAKCQCPSLG